MGGRFVAAGHAGRWVAGGAAPRGIHWAATGKLADIPMTADVATTDNVAPVVAAPLDDTANPRHLTEYEGTYESDDFA